MRIFLCECVCGREKEAKFSRKYRCFQEMLKTIRREIIVFHTSFFLSLSVLSVQSLSSRCWCIYNLKENSEIDEY